MSTRWIRCLVWLVALALPLQAMAAASMLHCTAHAAAVQTADAPHDHAAHQGHGAQDAHGAHASAHSGADIDADSSPTDATPSVCSACAACCAAMALPGVLPDLPALDAAGTGLAAAPSGVLPFLTGGLERPPRPSRA